MHYDSWVCLMAGEIGIVPDDVQLALKTAACDMRLEEKRVMIFGHDACDGEIETEWKSYSVGTHRGILFRSRVNQDLKSYRVNFLLNEEDLKRGADILKKGFKSGAFVSGKSPGDPTQLPFLYQFNNLSTATASSARN
jgi:hypothetical protein